jgi:exosortase/archaeosortase family protein
MPAVSRRALALRFGLAFPALSGGLLAAAAWLPWLRPARDALVVATAGAAGHLLPLLGWDVTRDGTRLLAPGGHGVEVVRDCDALSPMLVLLAALAVTPAPRAARFGFALFGMASLFLLNQVRIGHLLWLSAGDVETFRRAHEVYWPAGLLVFAGGLFLLFAARAGRAA